MKRLALALALLATLLAATPSLASAPAIIQFFTRGSAYPGGQSPVVQINLSAVATSDVVIAITTDRPDVVTVPASVTVPTGKKNVQFSVPTKIVSAPVTVTLTASPPGAPQARTSFAVMPPQLLALSVPSKLTGGTSGSGSVRLSAPAPTGGVTVGFVVSSALLTLPETVTVAAGQLTARFTVSAAGTTSQEVVTVSASDAYGAVSRTVIVKPVALKSLSVSPGSIKGGRATKATVTLTGPALADTEVTLSAGSDLAAPPVSVTVPAGATKATVSVPTSDVEIGTRVSLTASLDGVSKTVQVRLLA